MVRRVIQNDGPIFLDGKALWNPTSDPDVRRLKTARARARDLPKLAVTPRENLKSPESPLENTCGLKTFGFYGSLLDSRPRLRYASCLRLDFAPLVLERADECATYDGMIKHSSPPQAVAQSPRSGEHIWCVNPDTTLYTNKWNNQIMASRKHFPSSNTRCGHVILRSVCTKRCLAPGARHQTDPFFVLGCEAPSVPGAFGVHECAAACRAYRDPGTRNHS